MYVHVNVFFSTTGGNEKFWYVSSSGLVCTDGDKPEEFFFEFAEYGRVGIKCQNGKYLRGDQGGILMGDGLSVEASSLWEHWVLYHRDTNTDSQSNKKFSSWHLFN